MKAQTVIVLVMVIAIVVVILWSINNTYQSYVELQRAEQEKKAAEEELERSMTELEEPLARARRGFRKGAIAKRSLNVPYGGCNPMAEVIRKDHGNTVQDSIRCNSVGYGYGFKSNNI